jgi:wyosine [tRNA(Phe)-imidazoG37] synthetase (radical SAM superfamily)
MGRRTGNPSRPKPNDRRTTTMPQEPTPKADFHHHPRDWRNLTYVYPVVSRRSNGLSIGINLNPDKACNFDCVYCQVDRTIPPTTRNVDLTVLESELNEMLSLACSGRIFDQPEFRETPPQLRRLNDIAFSGDGEPTTCPVFHDAVKIAARLRTTHNAQDAQIVLITDACYLSKPNVREALRTLDDNNGQIWAKLDAGTEAYYQLVNRPNFPLSHVIDNITAAAKVRPVTIQAMFMRLHNTPPSTDEIIAFTDRLLEMTQSGARFNLVQVYTIARNTAESYATPLQDDEIDVIAETVAARTKLPVQTYYG